MIDKQRIGEEETREERRGEHRGRDIRCFAAISTTDPLVTEVLYNADSPPMITNVQRR